MQCSKTDRSTFSTRRSVLLSQLFLYWLIDDKSNLPIVLRVWGLETNQVKLIYYRKNILKFVK